MVGEGLSLDLLCYIVPNTHPHNCRLGQHPMVGEGLSLDLLCYIVPNTHKVMCLCVDVCTYGLTGEMLATYVTLCASHWVTLAVILL